jgi:hypothetical protein
MTISMEAAIQIEGLHQRIAKIIEAEKVAWDKRNPNENEFRRSVAHCQIEWLANSPRTRTL